MAAAMLSPAGPAAAAQDYDYFQANREMSRNGVQAVLMCNGLFTSGRSLTQVFEQELAYLPEGIGCVVTGPNEDFGDIDTLPALDMPAPPGEPDEIPWPDGDRVEPAPLPEGVDAAALQAASDWAFDRPTPEQDTLSLLVVHDGRIIHERYAEGVDREEHDPRDAITLRRVLHMSSGLYPVDSFGMEYATGSGPAYWAGASSVDGARRRGLIRQPGTFWPWRSWRP